MVDAADKDGTGLLTEKEFMQSGATEVKIIKNVPHINVNYLTREEK